MRWAPTSGETAETLKTAGRNTRGVTERANWNTRAGTRLIVLGVCEAGNRDNPRQYPAAVEPEAGQAFCGIVQQTALRATDLSVVFSIP